MKPAAMVVAASSVVLAKINNSLCTCRRRLVNMFSKAATIPLPKPRHSPKKKGFRKLRKTQIDNNNNNNHALHKLPILVKLPPPEDPRKKTIFLDLDETLIHSSVDPPQSYDFIVRPTIEGEIMTFYVLKRPGVDKFLHNLSKKFEIVIFTAGLRQYASLVLDHLDINRVISHRLYRDSCHEIDGKFIKDLSKVGRDLSNAVIVDDNPCAFEFQPENAIRIKSFIDDLADRELEKLIVFFDNCDQVEDLRDALKEFTNQDFHLVAL